MKKVHFSCGANIFEGWDNLDKNPRTESVIYYDALERFSYVDEEVDYIYHEHFIEHLTKVDAQKFLKECFRILKPNGVMRLSTPNLSTLVDCYIKKDVDFFKRKRVPFFPVSPADLLNYGITNWEHKYTYDFDEISKLLNQIGFVEVTPANYRIGYFSRELDQLECRPDINDLIVECKKPEKDSNA